MLGAGTAKWDVDVGQEHPVGVDQERFDVAEEVEIVVNLDSALGQRHLNFPWFAESVENKGEGADDDDDGEEEIFEDQCN